MSNIVYKACSWNYLVTVRGYSSQRNATVIEKLVQICNESLYFFKIRELPEFTCNEQLSNDRLKIAKTASKIGFTISA